MKRYVVATVGTVASLLVLSLVSEVGAALVGLVWAIVGAVTMYDAGWRTVVRWEDWQRQRRLHERLDGLRAYHDECLVERESAR